MSPPNQPLLRELSPPRAKARHTRPGAGSSVPPTKHSHGTSPNHRCKCRVTSHGAAARRAHLGSRVKSPGAAKTRPGASPAQPPHCEDMGKCVFLFPAFLPSLCLFPKTTHIKNFYIIFLLLPKLVSTITFQPSHHFSKAPTPSPAFHPIARLTSLTAVATAPLNGEKSACI